MRVRIIVSGLVQGVGYRSFVQRTAAELELAGWVRNREDGKVEAVFEGPADAVREAIAACRRGPARSMVGKVAVREEAAEGITGFRVHREED